MSVLEIELKAWIDDPEQLRQHLKATAESIGVSHKLDLYLCGSEADPLNCDPRRDRIVRIRDLGKECLLTVKHKQIEDGIEVNVESELGVDGAAAAEELLRALGFQAFLRKEKRTELFRDRETPELVYELNEIVGLGWFIELEWLLPAESGAEQLAAVRERLQGALAALGVDPERIEPRLYMEMLRERPACTGD